MRIFEFDEQKSQINLQKHGIDFLDAQELWFDPEFVELDANSDVEIRKLVIGLIKSFLRCDAFCI